MKATTSARRWIKNQHEWLDEAHPLAVSLILIAQAMDAEEFVPASLATSFRLTMGDLQKLKPVEEDGGSDDPDGLFND